MDMKEARVRVKAKQFKSRIGIGLCMPIPDDIADGLADDEVQMFFKACESVGLRRIEEPAYLYGHWERR